MKKKTYFENLNDAVISNNQKALAYRDGLAWDNKKRKTSASHMPRGKCYRRFVDMEWRNNCSLMRVKMARIQAAYAFNHRQAAH